MTLPCFPRKRKNRGYHGPPANEKASLPNGRNSIPSAKRNSIWARSKANSSSILRALGLGVIPDLSPHQFRSKHLGEPLKIAVRRHRVVALARSLIHLVPVGVSLWLVVLNWNTYYVGSFTYDQIIYQVGAKILEIMIQASLAATLLAYVRHEVVRGEGLPFGALFSGLQINQISYLWSMEFWGSMRSRTWSTWRKIAMSILIFITFILAAAAGPSGAVLLIPRRDYWPAGATNIWINGTFNDLWPLQLNSSSVPTHCAISSELLDPNSCPASEWQILEEYFRLGFNSLPDGLSDGNAIPPSTVEISGKNSLRQLQIVEVTGTNPLLSQNNIISTSIGTTQHAAIADALALTGATWELAVQTAQPRRGHGVYPSNQQSAIHTISSGYFQPYTAVTCMTNPIEGDSDQRPVIVPASILNSDYKSVPNGFNNNSYIPAVDYPLIKRSELLNLPGSTSSYRAQWFNLPQDLFNASALGVIVVFPNRAYNTSSNSSDGYPTQISVSCNLGAGWGSSSMNTTSYLEAISATSSLINFDTTDYWIDSKTTARTLYPVAPVIDFYQEVTDSPVFFYLPRFPERQIEIKASWGEYLNPTIPNLNRTVLDYLLTANGDSPYATLGTTYKNDNVYAVQLTLTALLTNGLARVGYDYSFQGTPRVTSPPINYTNLDGTFWVYNKGDFFTVDPNQSRDWLKFKVVSTIQGYAYNTHGSSAKIAIAFLLLYCFLALASTLYAAISGISSTAWDSISEVTALAINSAPTKGLQNTCAGISKIRTFKTLVRVLVRKDEGEGEGEHLEMVFGEDVGGHEGDEGETIVANRRYGTVPASLLVKRVEHSDSRSEM